MYIRRSISPCIVFFFSWRTVLFSLFLSSLVYVVYQVYGVHQISIPFLPVATVGTAVAFYVGFKNNSSYDRLWEARKIWGDITNATRAFAALSIASIHGQNAEAIRTQLIRRQLAFANSLRMQLRKRNVWDDSHIYVQLVNECGGPESYDDQMPILLHTYLSEEEAELVRNKGNPAKDIHLLQLKQLKQLRDSGVLTNEDYWQLQDLVLECLRSQGGAERIKNFPFPRQYANFSDVFVKIFIVLLPFGLIGDFDKMNDGVTWMTIPFSVLIAWIFMTMEQIGDTSENPFEHGINDVPMSAICRQIEIDVLEYLGESKLPEPLAAVNHVLM